MDANFPSEYLFDTDICVYLMRGHQELRERLESLHPEIRLYTTIVNAMELHFGASLFHDPAAESRRVRQLLKTLTVLPLSDATIPRYCAIKSALRKTNRSLSENDLYIASVALEHDLVLVTHNRKHFERVPGLVLEDWMGA